MTTQPSSLVRGFQPLQQYFNSLPRPRQNTLISATALSLSLLVVPRKWLSTALKQIALSAFLPFALLVNVFGRVSQIQKRSWLQRERIVVSTTSIDESQFASISYLDEVITKLFESGLRSTASKAHESFIKWVEDELTSIDGLNIESDEFEVLRWQTLNDIPLKDAGNLIIHEQGKQVNIEIAGVVPYSKPTKCSSGQLIYLPRKKSLLCPEVLGRIVVRELPKKSLPMMLGRLPAYSTTSDMQFDFFKDYERPSFWEHPIHNDLVDAGKAGAAGVIFLIEFPRSQVSSYWDPHQGTHYQVPAVFCASEDMAQLRLQATNGIEASISVKAEISPAKTRNVFATLPGQIEETIVYATHTDGNTCVQDNGVAGLLALAKYFAKQPVSSRRRTIQFAFNTAHLHVSKEGSGRHATQLDEMYDKNDKISLVVPVEHLGTQELEAYPTDNGIGRVLKYTGKGEIMIWCVGPSTPVLAAVRDAVARRKLDRVMITRGVGLPRLSRVPAFASFGGLGTLYHNCLLPTTSLISGPYSLFAPSFGKEAVDVSRLRQQTLALGDVFLALEDVSREQIAGGYLEYRRRRAEHPASYDGFTYPPEQI